MNKNEVFEEKKRRDASALPLRTILNGRYEVGRVLGRGGFGITYLAWDVRYDYPVAIKEFFPEPNQTGIDRKVVHGKMLPDLDIPQKKIFINGQMKPFAQFFQEEVANFQAEAKKLVAFRKVNHIATVIDDFTQHNTAYYVMEYYQGQSLQEAWEEQSRQPWGLQKTIKALYPMMEALEKVHAKGLIHRDFKPHNVLLCQDEAEEVVLIDFGLAKALGNRGVISSKATLGTPLYAPYEQHSVIYEHGPYSDVYSVAATFYQLLTGSLPVLATNREERVRHGQPDPMQFLEKGLPKNLKTVLDKAIAIYPKDRYATMHEFRDALKKCLGSSEERFVMDVKEVLAQPQAVAPPPPQKVAPAPSPKPMIPAEPRLVSPPRAGDRQVLTIKGVEFAFRYCPPGSFRMGDDASSWDDEKPAHAVEIQEGFWMGETPVTQAQWVALMGSNPSYFSGENRPVEQVSWEDCQAYCAQLNGLGVGVFRLPLEEEWEYACRAGSSTRYYFGDDEKALEDHAWYGANSGGATHPVGEKLPNAWGLVDMHGNVWEWTNSERTYNYAAFRNRVKQLRYSQVDTSKLTKNSNKYRVLRGGSWYHDPLLLRAAFRYVNLPAYRGSSMGFRLAKALH
ncbi:MAG TPA: bifunctional serine/threonine-protein kinase/formylglycine-generating enzyme family protein [Rhodothermales bacterium]|nr:bifunctional serine/threonine-protein kinase/formylglycine-generating enzyme family protein [Rhodothermales bacterium]